MQTIINVASPYVAAGCKKDFSNISVQDLINATSRYLSVDIQKRIRETPYVYGRQLVCSILKENTTLSLKQIGELFGYDHTTVIHSCREIRDKTDVDKMLNRHTTENDIKNILGIIRGFETIKTYTLSITI